MFVAEFAERHGLTLDRVYVAKTMFGTFAWAQQGRLAVGTRIVAIVTVR